MLEVIINRFEVNCTTINRIYTEYYSEKKTNVNVCPKKCDFFKQTRPHEKCHWINILDKQSTKLRQHVQKIACLLGYVAYVTLFQNITWIAILNGLQL